MARSFTSTAPNTSADYYRYLFDVPTKDDRDGDAITLTFTLAATDASFARLSRGNYISLDTLTYPKWFTGYIINEPEYQYLGVKNNTPHWGYKYMASSDEIILSQNSLGIIPPFYNMTQGAIIKTLANLIAPGLFDTTNVDDGMLLARYVVNPTKKFGDVVSEFSASGLYRFYGKDHKLYFVAKDELTQGIAVDGHSLRFTPGDLTCKGSTNVPIINDVVVVGNIEPQRFTTEYFLGTGFDGQFALSASAFGVESVVLLDDDFSGNSFDSSKWTVYDQPTNYLQLFSGYVNVVGGTGDMADVHLDSAMSLAVSGNVRLAHGEYDFVPQTSNNLVCGVIGGLWTQAPNNSYTGCLYGIRVNKTAGIVTLSPIVNGVVDTTQSITVDTNGQSGNPPLWDSGTSYLLGQSVVYNGVYYVCIADTAPGDLPTDQDFWAVATSKRYVIRTILSTQETFRAPQTYSYRAPDGSIIDLGGDVAEDVATLHTYITELDPNTGEITNGFPVVWSNTFNPDDTQGYALYVAAASKDLHVTFTDVTISNPMQATLGIQSNGTKGYQNKLVGPNEVDATDGLAPFATITQSGGVNQKQNVLGTPQYAFGNPTLTFFKDSANLTTTVPKFGDVVRLSYRSAGAAIGRARSQASIVLESKNWGDSGVRSVVRSGDITPIPTTSTDCETAAAAIIGQNSFTHYEGQYTIPSENVVAEPVAGATMAFSNLPSDAFPATSFAEPIYEVVTTFDATSGGEHFTHQVTYGLKSSDNNLLRTLARFELQGDVFAVTDSTEIPAYVPVESVDIAHGPKATGFVVDPTNAGQYGSWAPNATGTIGQVILDSNNNLQQLTDIVVPIKFVARAVGTSGGDTQGQLTITSDQSIIDSVHATNTVVLKNMAQNPSLNDLEVPVLGVIGNTVTVAVPLYSSAAQASDIGYIQVKTKGSSVPKTGATEPVWASTLPTKAQLLGTAIACPSVTIANNLLTVVGEADLTESLNVGCDVELSDFSDALFLNGLTARILDVDGKTFTAGVQRADFTTVPDTGIATIVSQGANVVLTNDGTAQWTLLGRAVGKQRDKYFFDAGQAPTPSPSYVAASVLNTTGGFEVRYTDASWGCDDGKNLAGRFTSRYFNLPRVPRNSVLFLKAYDIRNWLLNSEDLTGNWTGSSIVTLVSDTNPDGDLSAINSVAFTSGTPSVSQSTGSTTFNLLNIPVSFSVSLKGTAGQQVTLQVGNGASLHGDKTVTLTGQWQRETVNYTFTSGTTSALTVKITAGSTPMTVKVTRASLEVNSLVETAYCKTRTADHSTASSFYGAVSQYAASIRLKFPFVPQSPTAGIDFSNPAAPVLTVIPPSVLDDVWGIEVRRSDNLTVLYSGNLTDSNYTQQITDANNLLLNPSYYVYAYNLLGEYSDPFLLNTPNPYYQTDSVVGQNLLANPGFEKNALGLATDTARISNQLLIDDWYVK